ncbi:MAG: aspartate/glutamate racemase family protein [Clostridia bacterium]|nr:aspartate/glutamate racemase family protein [Clostridia bacterium]
MIYKAKKGQMNYGEAIGILLLDFVAPFIPGDVGNASTYHYPVRYKLVEGLTFDRLLNKDKTALDILIKAAKELEKDGVRGVTADCGFFALFQKEIADALDVPVFLSSLLQGSFISTIVGKGNKVGVISAVGSSLDETFFNAVNADKSDFIVKGLEDTEHFKKFGIEESGVLDTELIEGEVVTAAKEMIEENPNIKAILLECSMLPPYGKAVQDATGLPVFDFITMIDYVFSAVVKKRYDGFL